MVSLGKVSSIELVQPDTGPAVLQIRLENGDIYIQKYNCTGSCWTIDFEKVEKPTIGQERSI